MSETVICETKYTCEETLKEALGDLGIPPDRIQVHDVAVEMEGTRLIEGQKANIIIKGAHQHDIDVGFEKLADGTFKTIVSSRSHTGHRILSKANHGTGELDQFYAKRAVLRAVAKNYGHSLKSCEAKNGKIQIKVSVLR